MHSDFLKRVGCYTTTCLKLQNLILTIQHTRIYVISKMTKVKSDYLPQSTNRLLFVMETQCVFPEAEPGLLHIEVL